jgi:hypothetical protein
VNRNEFKEATGRLGDLVLTQVLHQFSDRRPGLIQWNILCIFGVYIPIEDINKESARERPFVCSVCWSTEPHDEDCHDFTNKQEMADLLLGLEDAIRTGVAADSD